MKPTPAPLPAPAHDPRLIVQSMATRTPLEAGIVEHFRRTGQTAGQRTQIARYPRNIEEAYTRELIAMVNRLLELTKAAALRTHPALTASTETRRPTRTDALEKPTHPRRPTGLHSHTFSPTPQRGRQTRYDDLASSVKDMIGNVLSQFGQTYNPAKVGGMARAAVVGVDEHTRRQAADALKGTIGIDMAQAEPWLEGELRDHTYINTNLITSISTGMLDDVQAAIIESWRTGGNTRDLTDRIEQIGKVTRNRARLIARDQIGKMSSQLETLRMQSYGLEEYDWICTNDKRARPMHRALHLKRFKVGDPPVTNSSGDRNEPGQDYQCRCSRRWVVPGLEDIAKIEPLQELGTLKRAPIKITRRETPKARPMKATPPSSQPVIVRPAPAPVPGYTVPAPVVTPTATPGMAPAPVAPTAPAAAPKAEAKPTPKAPPHLAPYLPPEDGSPIKVKPPHWRGNLPQDPEMAARILINQWVHGSQRRAAVLMKHAIKAELGLNAGVPFSKHVYRFTQAEIDQARPAVRHLYEQTQAALKKQARTQIVLHRGVSRDYPIRDTAEAWADDQTIAADFARRKNPATAKIDSQSIPAHRVLTWHQGPLWQNGKYGHQAEWIVLTEDPKP